PEAYDHPSRVYIHISKISPVGEVECAEETTPVPHKPMPGAGRSIEAEPCDLSSIVDGLRNGLAETGDIDHDNNPVGLPQETMIITHGVVIGPRDRSYRVNTGGSCEAETERAGTGRIKFGHMAVRISDEAMRVALGVKIKPRGLPGRIDGDGKRPREITRRYVSIGGIKRCDRTEEVPHKAVQRAIRVTIEAHGLARRVQVTSGWFAEKLVLVFSGPRGVERGERALRAP